MDIELNRISYEERITLENMFQLYTYDFSEFTDFDLDERGLFGLYPYLENYWTEKDIRFPYFIKANGKLAGFVLVRIIQTELGFYNSIAEFFVMRKYRKLGIGKKAANMIFGLHKGNWEVYQLEMNLPAQVFWGRVISEYSNGEYQNKIENGKVIQNFTS